MKHLKLFLLAALALAACTKEETTDQKKDNPGEASKELSFILKSDNITVVNAEYDYLVSVLGNTAVISLDYLDKVNATALKVQFVNLPSGITASGFQETYDYVSNGAQNFKFTDGTSSSAEYSLGVAFTDPDPQMVSAAVNGVAVTDGKVQLSASADLSQAVLTFTVSPEDTKVVIKGTATEVKSGDVVDFSDKINGVSFTLSCGSVTKDMNIKVITSGISKVTRVWGHYVSPATITDDWFGTKVNGTLDLLRTVGLNDEYVFLSRDVRKQDKVVVEKTGVYAIKISDPEDVVSLPNSTLDEGDRIFAVSALGDNAIAATFAMAASSHFKIYKYTSLTSEPTLMYDYVLPEAMRLGDRITVEGNMTSGKIWAYDSTSGAKVVCFTVTDGKITAAPVIVDLIGAKGGTYSGFYKYADGEYILAGNTYASNYFAVSGTTATSGFAFPTTSFSVPMHGLQFFTVNGVKYMGYVILQNNFCDGQFRITPLTKETLQASIEEPANPYVYCLGDPESTELNNGVKNGNGIGMGMFRTVGEHNYYVAYVPGTGLSLFDIQ